MHELFSPGREDARLSNRAQPDVDPGMIMPHWNAAPAWMARLVVSQLLPITAKSSELLPTKMNIILEADSQ